MTELGRPPRGFGDVPERLHLWRETAHANGQFELSPLAIESARVLRGANDRIPTAEVTIALEPSPAEVPPSSRDYRPRDWQLRVAPSVLRDPREYFGGGRRLQIRTARPQPADDWCLFEGFIDRISRGASSAGQNGRWLKLYATSTIVAADRCRGQHVLGQWRRTRGAEVVLAGGAGTALVDDCVRVTAVPAVFNLDGLGNCDPRYAVLAINGTQSVLPLFADTLRGPRGDAKRWNVARMLRYLQWAAMQPLFSSTNEAATPEEPYLSNTLKGDLGVFARAGNGWTPFGLLGWKDASIAWPGDAPRDMGPNLDFLIEPYLQRDDAGGIDVLDQALMRTPANVAIEGLSIIEAFAHICDLAGLMCYVDQQMIAGGRCVTYLRFALRGARCSNATRTTPADFGEIDTAQRLPSSDVQPRDGSASDVPCTSRGVYLYVGSDRTRSVTGASANATARAAFGADAQNELEITEDISVERTQVVVIGDGVQYECTFNELVPAWRPNSAWDVRRDDTAENAALAAVGSLAWERGYGAAIKDLSTLDVGRVWALNEDGVYDATNYRRTGLTGHPWEPADKWQPYKWRSASAIYHLVNRGDDLWSTRRRRFLPMTPLKDKQPVGGPICVLSFDAGVSWYRAEACNASVSFDPDRCSLRITGDLRGVRVGGPDGVTLPDYVTAYITKKLRVGVFANVEGDDALFATSQGGGAASDVQWVEMIDRRGKLGRKLRYRDAAQTLGAANDWLITAQGQQGAGWNQGVVGVNQDSQGEARQLAIRLQREMAVPRITGTASIPWLWRDGRGPVSGYQIGDEVLGIVTGDEATFVSFTPGRDVGLPATRIVGIAYSYSGGEQSTTLTLEDRVAGIDDVMGAPGVLDQNAPWRQPNPAWERTQ